MICISPFSVYANICFSSFLFFLPTALFGFISYDMVYFLLLLQQQANITMVITKLQLLSNLNQGKVNVQVTQYKCSQVFEFLHTDQQGLIISQFH